MVTTLNLTLPIKQDIVTKAKLLFLQNKFKNDIQPVVEAALRKSGIVHYARFVLIGDDFLQILTEFDGEFRPYTDFFANELGPVFAELFSLVDGAPTAAEVADPDKFFKYIQKHNLPPVGDYVFSAYGERTVKDIQAKLNS